MTWLWILDDLDTLHIVLAVSGSFLLQVVLETSPK